MRFREERELKRLSKYGIPILNVQKWHFEMRIE